MIRWERAPVPRATAALLRVCEVYEVLRGQVYEEEEEGQSEAQYCSVGSSVDRLSQLEASQL